MDILRRLKILRTEDFIWITYFFIAAFAIFSNSFERDFVITKKNKSQTSLTDLASLQDISTSLSPLDSP